MLLSATGPQFCAGGDIREFVANRDRLDRLVADILDVVHPAIHQLATLPLPVISAVQGPIGGAGIAVALCADLVLASSAMFVRGGYSAIGLSPDLGASYFLARRSSAARAKYVLMTNRPIPAEACLHWGLVNGKTQTHLNWGHRPGEPDPPVWQHDLFHGDYRPYEPGEIASFRRIIGTRESATP